MYWWEGRYVSGDLDTAIRLLGSRGCDRAPGPADVVVRSLPADPAGRSLVGRPVRYPSFYRYALRH